MQNLEIWQQWWYIIQFRISRNLQIPNAGLAVFKIFKRCITGKLNSSKYQNIYFINLRRYSTVFELKLNLPISWGQKYSHYQDELANVIREVADGNFLKNSNLKCIMGHTIKIVVSHVWQLISGFSPKTHFFVVASISKLSVDTFRLLKF